MQDLMDAAIELDSGQHHIWQTNRGLLSALFLPDPKKLLSLPPGMPRWHQFTLDLAPQQTVNLTVNIGRRTWLLALLGQFDQDEGYKANFWDAMKKRNILGDTREFIANLVGTATSPAWLVQPYEMAANSALFIRVTNLSTNAGTGELVIYAHMEGEP